MISIWLAYIILLAAYLVTTYDIIQNKRPIKDRPVVWTNKMNLAWLGWFWIALLTISLAVGFVFGGVIHVASMLVLYYVIFPLVLDRFVVRMLYKLGR